MVNFDKMVVESKNNNGSINEIRIMRTVNNERERPDGDERHNSAKAIRWEKDDLKLMNPKNFEWLGWNYIWTKILSTIYR